MVRVCLVTPRAKAVDGWGRYAIELSLALRDHGVEPVLATCEREVDADVAGLEHHAILPPVVARRGEAPRSLLAAPRLRRVLATCDLVHGIAEPYMPLIALARLRRQPYVQTAHGTWIVRPFSSPFSRVFHAPALATVDLLLFQSGYTRDALARVSRLPEHVVLSGGVRPARFAQSTGGLLPARTLSGPIVLSVGSVKTRKGLHVALEAVARARAQVSNLQFVVAGHADRSSSYVAHLRERAKALGMAGAFHLLGDVTADELASWYSAADVFMLLPFNDNGSFEGLGLVYLEAGAAGLPSIGTLGCGAAEAIVDGSTGVLVPQQDAASAATAVVTLLRNDDLRARMSENARARANDLSWDRLADQLSVRYRRLLDARAAVS